MQAGLTPLTFTVGPRPPPGLLALRRLQGRDPKPGAKGHNCGWARAPHATPTAPNTSATGAHLQPRGYSRGLLQDVGERSEPDVARANGTTQSRASIGSHGRGKSGGGAKRAFTSPSPPGACALSHTLCRRSGAGRDARRLFAGCWRAGRDLRADWRRRGRPRRWERTQGAGGNVKSPRCLMGLLGAGDL